jgi:glycerate 2-kinase
MMRLHRPCPGRAGDREPNRVVDVSSADSSQRMADRGANPCLPKETCIMSSEPRRLLRAMFDAAVGSASPALRIPAHLPARPKGRTIVVGAGKASAAMAKAFEQHWDGPLSGLVVTRYGHAVPCERIEIVEAAHPVPDENGEKASRRILELVQGLGPDDLVVALISGGGSALLTSPAPGLTLADKRALNAALLRSGAPIGEMNVVRKHLSTIKGGRLAAAAHPARVVTLVISDVPGDDPSAIASGPTVPDRTTFAEARAVLAKYGITKPRAAIAVLERAAEESPKPGDPRLANAEMVMIATPQMSLEAAADVARRAGVTPLILGDAIEGEAREVGKVMAGIARQAALRGQPAPPPVALISGGETTVTIRGKGRGGRNVEFLLSLAVELDGQPGVWAISGDTDGVDGAEEVAGAVVTPDTLARASAKGIDAKASLADNDGHGFFEALDDQVVTGPTLTNVNDFRAVLIQPA